MKVKEVTEREPVVCRPEDSLERAAQVMWERDCGCVPVVDAERRPIGMITDRDVGMAAYLRGRALRDVGVHEVMTREVHCCREHDPLEVPHRLMREHQVRRLPVVDDSGVLVGIVSLADLVRCPDAQSTAPKRRKLADEMLTTYAALSRPRSAPSDVLVPRPVEPRAAASAARSQDTGRARGTKKS